MRTPKTWLNELCKCAASGNDRETILYSVRRFQEAWEIIAPDDQRAIEEALSEKLQEYSDELGEIDPRQKGSAVLFKENVKLFNMIYCMCAISGDPSLVEMASMYALKNQEMWKEINPKILKGLGFLPHPEELMQSIK